MGIRRLRVVVASVGLMVVVGLLGACGGDDDGGGGKVESAKDARIVYSLYDRTAAYFRGCLDGMQAEAKKLGANLDVQLSGPDATAQIQQIKNAMVKQPDAIIVTPIDTKALAAVTKEATDKGIPVFGVCDDIGANGKEAGESRVSFVGPDQVLIGRKKAQFIVDELDGKGRVGQFYGVRGVPFDLYTREGAAAVFKDAPGIDFREGPYAGEYSADAGLRAAQNLLTANPGLKGMICDNDDLCLGAVKALNERNIAPEDIVVVSNDGIQPAIDAVERGDIDYTQAFCGWNMGEVVMKQVVDLLVDGKAPPELTIDEGRDITRQNAANAEPVEKRCSDPALRVKKSEPKSELIEQLDLGGD